MVGVTSDFVVNRMIESDGGVSMPFYIPIKYERNASEIKHVDRKYGQIFNPNPEKISGLFALINPDFNVKIHNKLVLILPGRTYKEADEAFYEEVFKLMKVVKDKRSYGEPLGELDTVIDLREPGKDSLVSDQETIETVRGYEDLFWESEQKIGS